jgi:tetratricopeptide (TPR) repeat protein
VKNRAGSNDWVAGGMKASRQPRRRRHVSGYNCRGVAYEGLRDYSRAIADYDQSISINPKNGVAYWNRGNAYRDLAYKDLSKIDDAIRDYDQAIAINPKDFNSFNSRGKAYVAKGDRDHAIADYTQLSS